MKMLVQFELELDISYTWEPGLPASRSGHPDTWTPPEPEEFSLFLDRNQQAEALEAFQEALQEALLSEDLLDQARAHVEEYFNEWAEEDAALRAEAELDRKAGL